MREPLEALLRRHENLVAKHFELRVLPRHRALVLSGYATLRKFAETNEPRYEGGESRQVKEALRALLPPGGGYVLEVKLAPAMERQREATYPFFLTQSFASEAALEEEVARLRKAGFIHEHVYSVTTPTHEGEEP
jgi:hypothetical protein